MARAEQARSGRALGVHAGLFGTFRPVDRPVGRPGESGRGRGRAQALVPVVRRERALAFDMARQEQTNWCWAAVSTSVGRFFKPGAALAQCKLVAGQLGQADCCGAAGGGLACNQPWYLDAALEHLGRLAGMIDKAQSFTALQGEVDTGKPLCARIGWTGGGGHFVALSGWRIDGAGVAYVTVEDPWFGETDIPFETFCSAYRGAGSWTHSYFVSATERAAPQAHALAPKVRDPRSIGG